MDVRTAIVVRIRNTKTGVTAEVRPTGKLRELLTSFRPRPKKDNTEEEHDDDHDDHDATLESLAREIASADQEEILSVKVIPAK